MRRAALTLLLLPLAASCCGFPGGPPLPVYENLPPAEALQRLRARQAQVGTLVAEGTGSLSGTQGSDGSFRWQCWAQGTSRIRLVLTHRLKGLLADAVVEGDRAACYDPETGTVEKGPLGAIRVPGLSQTASLLRLLAGPADALAFAGDGNDPSRLVLALGGGSAWHLKLEERHLVYESAELRGADGGMLARVAFDLDRYRLMGAEPWPMRMTVTRPGEPWRLKLEFKEVHLGMPIEPEVFKLKTPE